MLFKFYLIYRCQIWYLFEPDGQCGVNVIFLSLIYLKSASCLLWPFNCPEAVCLRLYL